MSAELRRSRRIEIVGELEGRAIVLNEPVTIRELSLGGLTIETMFPFRTGSSHVFQITMGPASAFVRGRIVHQRPTIKGDHISYVSGVAFDVSVELEGWLRDFLDGVAADA